MKTRILLVCALLLTTCLVSAQSKRASRSPFLAFPRAAHEAGIERGTAPPNDNCADAQLLTVTSDCSAPIAGNNAEATTDGVDNLCDDPGADLLDVWYTFNSSTEDTVAITLANGPDMEDWAFVLYDGCAGTEVYCVIVPFSALNVPVSPDTDYWLRVYSNPTYGVGGSFTICVSTPVAVIPPPTNDECSGAVPQAVAIGNTVTFQGDNSGATDTEGLGQGSAWEAFTLSESADITIDYCGTAPAFPNFFVVLFPGCPLVGGIYPGSYNSTACTDGNWSMCFTGLSVGTYYYPVMAGVLSTGPYTLNVTAEPVGTNSVSNDECAGAVPLTSYTWCNPQTFTNGCASQSLPAVDCGFGVGAANDDVWYSFTATAPEMTIGGIPNGTMDIAMELFSGTCGSLTSIDCADVLGSGGTDTLVTSGLTVGNTYYLRVYDFRLQYAFLDPTYQLCLVEGSNINLSVGEAIAENVSALFPNPTTGDFRVQVDPRVTQVNIRVIDATGRTVFVLNERNALSGTVHVHAAGKLAPGLYTVRVNEGRTLSDTRLIIE
ncbi:MAG: T9SS type A sorting domain-containing protein [Flavobacteriales bacterium]